MNFKSISKKGFTLIEVTLAVAIIGMLVVLIAEMYMNGMISSEKEMRKSKLQVEAKNVLEGITYNVKLSSGIEPSYGGYTSLEGQNTLILKVPAIDSSDNFLYTGGQKISDYIVYYLDSNNSKELHRLIVSTDPRSRLYGQNNTNTILLNNAQSLTFNFDQPPPNSSVATVNLTVESIGKPETVSVSAQATRRNNN